MSEPKRFLRVPYDLRRPTKARFRERWWNHDDPHVLVPRVWGWGWDVNLAAVRRRLAERRDRRGWFSIEPLGRDQAKFHELFLICDVRTL